MLGQTAIHQLDIDICVLLREPGINTHRDDTHAIWEDNKPDQALHKACKQLCMKFQQLFKSELGCLKNYELEIAFQPNAKPVFCKTRAVPLAILEDLHTAYNAGIKKGIWVTTQFNE